MDIYDGKLSLVDSTHIGQFFGSISLSSTLQLIDNTHTSLMSGYVVNDTTHLAGDATYAQNHITNPTDMTMILQDWTYANAMAGVDGTLVGGSFGYRWFDPYWIHYEIYYQDYDTTQFSLVGYRYREAVRKNVGQYFANMVVGTPGHYQVRWVYQREVLGYAQEKVRSFTSMSRGLDAMRDYPTDSMS